MYSSTYEWIKFNRFVVGSTLPFYSNGPVKLEDFFFETSSSDVHFGAVSLIHSALQKKRCNTSQCFDGLFRSVMCVHRILTHLGSLKSIREPRVALGLEQLSKLSACIITRQTDAKVWTNSFAKKRCNTSQCFDAFFVQLCDGSFARIAIDSSFFSCAFPLTMLLNNSFIV